MPISAIKTQLNANQRQMSQIDTMLTRVRDVLPQVPVEVVRRDLLITASVDETITRLLDGTVTYVPLVPPSTSSSSNVASSPSKESISLQLASAKVAKLDAASLPSLHVPASSFSKSPSERMKSYHERKQALIEAARIRYMHKFIGQNGEPQHVPDPENQKSVFPPDPSTACNPVLVSSSINISTVRKGTLELGPDAAYLLEENRLLREQLSTARRELASLKEEGLRHRKTGSATVSPSSLAHRHTEKDDKSKGFAMSPYLMAFVALVLGLIFGKLVL